MRFDVVTLFPDLFAPFLAQGVTRRAYERPQGRPGGPSRPPSGAESPGQAGSTQESRRVDVRLWNLRDHAEGAYRRVDDRPFGGGPGMVMLAEPLERALDAIAASRAEGGASAKPTRSAFEFKS